MLQDSLVQVNDCKELYQNQAQKGGFMSIDNKYVSVVFKNSKLYNMQASVRGGIVDVLEVK